MNWQKAALLAFGLSIIFVYAPLITLIAGAILLAIYNGQEMKNVASKGVSFFQVLCLGFVIALAVQAVLTIIFGASFNALVEQGGLLAALKNSGAVKAEVTKEIFALIIVACAVYLVTSADKPQRRLFKWAIVLSVVALIFQSWNVNYPLAAGSQARHTMRLSLLREEALANIDARVKKWGLLLNRNTVLNEHIANMPTVCYAIVDTCLYDKDGDGVKPGKLVTANSRWLYLANGESIIDPVTGITYEPVVAYDDETKQGWLRLDKISWSKPAAKQAQSVPASIIQPALFLKPEADVILTEAEPALFPLEVGSKNILVKSGSWTSSSVAVSNGRLIFGPLAELEDVKRLQVKIGGQTLRLGHQKIDTGEWLAVADLGGGNGSRQPVELSLIYGFPLNVGIKGES